MSAEHFHQHSTKSPAHYTNREHIPREQFIRDVQGAVDTVLPVGSTPYGTVAVLSMTWDNDEMNCRLHESQLLKVMRSQYNFECTSKQIPSAPDSNPTVFVQRQIVEFCTKWDAADALLIFIYSGHAAVDYGGNMFWSGRTQTGGRWGLASPQIPWSEIKSLMRCEKETGRFLCILDCCCATAAANSEGGPEVLGACGHAWKDTSSGHFYYNFSNLLSMHLNDLQGKPQSVSQIFCDLIRNRQHWLKATPVHTLQKNRESVVLARQSRQDGQHLRISDDDRKKAILAMGEPGYKVQISVSLVDSGTPPNAENWKKWLTTNLPPDLRSISIELQSAMESDSMLLTITVPLEIWDGLPANKTTYSFVGFVKVRQQQAKQQGSGVANPAGLTQRVQGKENIALRGGRPGGQPGESSAVGAKKK